MKPTFLLRFALFLLNRHSADPDEQDVAGSESRPAVPLPAPSAQSLQTLRTRLGYPCFPVGLSSLRIRRWVDIRIPGPEGTLTARVFRPRGTARGVVLFLHGGGFVHCSVRSHHGLCCRLAAASGAVIVSLEYRLAPEHRFPAAFEDTQAALHWIARALPDAPLAVAGDSAGGTLAASVAQWARSVYPGRVQGQLLYYPALSGPVEYPSRSLFAQGYMLTQAALNWYSGQTLSNHEQASDPRFAPVLAPDLKGLPRALIVTAGCDPLRDEGFAYAAQLRTAGTPAQCVCYRRMIHGFLSAYSLLRDGRRALRVGGLFLRRSLERS